MRLRAPGCFLLCLMSTLFVACSGPETEEELLARASTALEERRLEAATIDIKTALQQNPESSAARVLLGRTYLYQRDPAAAAQEFQRALESGSDPDIQVLYAQARVAAGDTGSLLAAQRGANPPGSERAGYNAAVARAYALEGDFEAANAAIGRALELDAQDPYVRVSEALVLLRQDDRRFDAAEILARVTEEYPDNDEGWSVRAEVARLDLDFSSAAEWYAKAVSNNPYRLEDRLDRVGVLIELKELDAASNELTVLEQRVPNHPGVNYARGRILVENGEYREGLQSLSKVLAVIPDHSPTLYVASRANIQEGNLATAQSQLEKFVRNRPANLPARLQLAGLYARVDKLGAAERVAREVLEDDQMNTSAMRLLAFVLASQGLYAESAQFYERIAALDPDSVQDRAGLGAAQLMSGNAEAGIEQLEAALDMNPDNTALRERLIGFYLSTGDVAAAEEAVNEYLVVSESAASARILAARVAIQAGDEAKAKEFFQSVLDDDPADINANGGLALMAIASGDFDAARARFGAVLKAQNNHVPTLMNMAVLEERAGDSSAMVGYLERAISADGGALRPRLALARYRISQGQAGEAISLLGTVREQHKDQYDLHLVMASAFLASNQAARAAESGAEMLRLRPEDPAALAQVARIEQINGNFSRATSLAEKALASTPDNVELRKLLLGTLISENKLDRAAAELNRLPPAVREETGVAIVEGRLAMAQNRHSHAEAVFQRVFDTNPNSKSILFLAAAKWAQGNTAGTVSLLGDWLEENPEDHVVRNELAGKELALGNESSARSHFEVLYEVAPDNPVVLNNLAWLNRESAPLKALDYIEAANKLAPQSIDVLDTYAMVQRANGNVSEALELSDRVIASERGNTSPVMRFHRALILVDAGRGGEARDLLKSLVDGPDFPGKADAMALLDSLR